MIQRISRRELFHSVATACAVTIASTGDSDATPVKPRRYAVLLGINTPDAKPLPLDAAKYDLRSMGYLLTTCGFDGGSAAAFGTGAAPATCDAVRGRFRAVLGAVRSGDEVVFYFSGRGGANADGAPVLVLDEDDSGTNDLPLSEIAAWSRAVGKTGAAVTTILDAGFPLASQNTDCGRVVNPSPRVRRRAETDTSEPEPWNGGGLLLAASAPDRYTEAYEWRNDDDKSGGRGVFTEFLTTRALISLHNAELPTPNRVVSDLLDYLAARSGYLPAFQPVLLNNATNPVVANHGLFGVTTDKATRVLSRIPSLRRQVARLEADARERGTRLAVAVSVAANCDDIAGDWEDELRGALQDALAVSVSSPVRVLAPFYGRANCVVKIGDSVDRSLRYTVTLVGDSHVARAFGAPRRCDSRDAVRDLVVRSVAPFLAATGNRR